MTRIASPVQEDPEKVQWDDIERVKFTARHVHLQCIASSVRQRVVHPPSVLIIVNDYSSGNILKLLTG